MVGACRQMFGGLAKDLQTAFGWNLFGPALCQKTYWNSRLVEFAAERLLLVCYSMAVIKEI